jgi:hypothetical protein
VGAARLGKLEILRRFRVFSARLTHRAVVGPCENESQSRGDGVTARNVTPCRD